MSSTNPKRLKIAYLCDISPEHTQPYSGGNARIYRALSDHVGDVEIIDNSWGWAEPIQRLIYALPERFELRLRWRMHLLLAPVIARKIRRELRNRPYDVVFGAYSFQSMYRLRPPSGMLSAFTADATPTTYKRSAVGQSFGSFFSPMRYLDPLILRAERKTFREIDLLLWPSDWLKDAADALYDLSPEQSLMRPWGANINAPAPPPVPEIGRDKPLKLLFVGRDWHAKGGPEVLALLDELRGRGVNASLTVIGNGAPEAEAHPHVSLLGAINKAIPEEMARFEAAFHEAHFLTMPSFESWGFAFCEASAYGLPSLCMRSGGIPVRDGVNGYALPIGARPSDFADIAERYVSKPKDYAALCKTTRQEFEDRLNWDAWGKSVAVALAERL